jgi:hypothetical protein
MALDYLNYTPFSGVGNVNFFLRNAATGALDTGGYDLGEVPVFKITKTVPTVEMNTSRSVDRAVAFRMAQSKSASVEIQVKTMNDFVEGLLHNGVWTEKAAGQPVVNWPAPAGLVVGQVIKLADRNVSAVTVVDSTGSPKTLPATQYDLDPVGGTIKLKDITAGGAYVQPFKVSYTPGAIKTLGALKATDLEWGLHFNGTNAYDGTRKIVEGYRFRFAAEGDSDFIMEQYGTWTIKGSLLRDDTKQATGDGGQYYAITKV